jgi:hypothetical protein
MLSLSMGTIFPAHAFLPQQLDDSTNSVAQLPLSILNITIEII